MTHFFACLGEGWPHHESKDWGPCRRVIEVLDDQKAGRQSEFYKSGQVLIYDRGSPRDRFGMLVACRFSRKLKWRKSFIRLEDLTAHEFQREWNKAVGLAVLQAAEAGPRCPRTADEQ